MKKIILLTSLLLIYNISLSQCTTHSDKINCVEDSILYTDGTREKIKYCGALNDRGERDGCGTLYFLDNSSVYEYFSGRWENGSLNGSGEIKNKNGERYSGEFVNDKLKNGSFSKIENDTYWTYEGDFNGFTFEGIGKETVKNSDRIVSRVGRFFADNLFEGKEEIKFINTGVIIKNELVNGVSKLVFRNDVNRRSIDDIIGDKEFSEIDLTQRGTIEDNTLAYDVNLEINGIEYEFLLDSGAMSFTVGKLMYERLKKAGVKYTDLNNIESVFGVVGEALTNTVIFDEIKIGDYIVKNVVAKVMLDNNSSLLGTGFLLKFSDVHWNMNDNKLILYK